MKKALLAASCLLLAAAGAMANVVSNPGFETQGAGGSWDPADWWRTDNVWRNDSNPRTGSWHLSIDGIRDPAAAQTILNLSGWQGWLITASCWIDVVGGTGGNVYFGANQRDSAGNFISNHESGPIWQGWEQSGYDNNPVLNFTGAANLNRIELYFKADEVSGRRFDIDDVSLTAIPEPATMGLMGLGALALVLRRKIKK